MADYDLVIRGGTVFDGTGGESFVADVAIKDGRIAEVGSVTGQGADEIEAEGRIVTPGFIDVHTHYDGQITWEHRLAPSSDHGVTTVVMGNCGVGFAPIRKADHEIAVKLMEGVEDIPEVVMTAGVPWNWETFPEYLDAIEKRESDIDFCAQLPHSPLRVWVMGERGVNLEPPTDDDLAEMRRLTKEAIEAGAIGVTTSRSFAHRFKDGRPAPSVKSEDQEVLALAAGLKDAGPGVFQMVPRYDVSPTERFNLLREIAKMSGRPVSFTFMQAPHEPSSAWQGTLQDLSQAKQDGLEIRGQVIPRPTGAMLGLELSLHPFALNPSYREIADLPLDQKVARMKDPAFRAQLLSEEPQDPFEFFLYVLSDLDNMFVLGDPPNYNPAQSESIGARARAAGISTKELLYDALLQRDGQEVLYRPLGNAEGEKFESSRFLLDHDRTVVALGDGGAHYSMICDAAYTTYLLTYWVKNASPDKAVPLAQAVRMLSRDAAELAGLRDRGLVKPGYKADLNVIDMDRLHLHAPHATYDLPADGRRLSQQADGYEATIVSGVVTYREGVSTGALPGRLQRFARPDPEPAKELAAA
ncbi:MAG: amidohydrolase family protein [Sphingomicrobium sp.]